MTCRGNGEQKMAEYYKGIVPPKRTAIDSATPGTK